MNDIELLSAYYDGELPDDEARGVEKRLKNDSSFCSAYKKLEQSMELYKASIGDIDTSPIGSRLESLLEQEGLTDHIGKVIEFPSEQRKRHAHHARYIWGASIAASIALCVSLVNFHLSGDQSSEPLTSIAAEHALPKRYSDLMDHSYSGQIQIINNTQIKYLSSFINNEGSLCKVFEFYSDSKLISGVACKSGRMWVQKAVAEHKTSDNQSQIYIPASGGVSAVDEYIESHIDGVPLTLEEEKKLAGKNEK